MTMVEAKQWAELALFVLSSAMAGYALFLGLARHRWTEATFFIAMSIWARV